MGLNVRIYSVSQENPDSHSTMRVRILLGNTVIKRPFCLPEIYKYVFIFSCIDFRGTHTNKAQYIRLAFDTKPELVLSLLLREWCLERPKLLITTTGTSCRYIYFRNVS